MKINLDDNLIYYAWAPSLETIAKQTQCLLAPSLEVAKKASNGAGPYYKVRAIRNTIRSLEYPYNQSIRDMGIVSGTAILIEKVVENTKAETTKEQVMSDDVDVKKRLCELVCTSHQFATAVGDAINDNVLDGLEDFDKRVHGALGINTYETVLTDDSGLVYKYEFDDLESHVSDHEQRLDDLENNLEGSGDYDDEITELDARVKSLEDSMDRVNDVLSKTDEHMTEEQRERFKAVVKECILELLK